jgi:hypothetical protein
VIKKGDGAVIKIGSIVIMDFHSVAGAYNIVMMFWEGIK